jgi:hypothetical protein
MLQTGDGVPADPGESVKWLQKAADQQDADAESSLGIAYVKGLGVEPSLLAARYWAERSAAHGSDYGAKFAALIQSDFKSMEESGKLPRTIGGDGSSFERAVVLPDIKTEMQGVRAEHKVFIVFFRGWQWGTQSLLNQDGRAYDLIELTRGTEKRDLYFDISNWFGHLE